ncbi:ABC transporter substrate-binding protein [Roseomonas marmotae]|uniref:ABC transporter substrate-binding protein n=1 Tax=Roseomonas marmotae TaxID=2768161 RepID=A0ABS3K8W6_9PROT|nr:ABC transporter substrate-binding protein [Roseomonas marmotae]MBO1073457.1 ABC transporter substrate-binding protein [Roseomonas marmotae]QTI80348.1 ABC transporter substrate-binding protein [Roseomonas marmotae]
MPGYTAILARRALLPALALSLTASLPATAQTLRVALSAETTSADPLNYAVAPNNTLRQHIFEPLVELNADLAVEPALAESWKQEGELEWTFRLRQGVRFHNGRPLTAADVLFTYCRAQNNKDEVVQSYSRIIRRLAKVEVLDSQHIRITTREPEPLLLNDLSNLPILPQSLIGDAKLDFAAGEDCGHAGPWPGAAQFNDASAAIGTGPYKLVSYSRNAVTELARFDDYWGTKPAWQTVRMTPVTAAGPRMAGLLAGDYDIIESPATGDLPRLRENANFRISAKPTTRLIFLQLDTGRSPSPFVNGGQGQNPLQDVRVRQALSLAIDRKAIEQRVMDGLALPAAQFLQEGMAGTIPGLPVLPYDPAKARELLKQAGYADGFTFTFHATNNRYINDARLAQVLAQFWQRIGVKVELDAMPSSVFFGRRGKREFSVAMGGWGSDAAETLMFFRTWLMSTDREKGVGTSNYGGWSHAPFDELAGKALVTMDGTARAALLRQAGQVALEQMPVIPVQFESAVWAFRKDIAYPGRVDQTTMASEISPAR